MAACPSCGTAEQMAGARFCHACGGQLATTCTSCDAALAPDARFCSSCGTPQGGSAVAPAARVGGGPSTGNHHSTAERRVTSILFGDLVGFTSLSEALDQEDARELLSGFFDHCRQIIDRYGGTVEKFIGDAVMAVWGVPTAHEDDAERAVRAGLELVEMVTDLRSETSGAKLAMRVGVVTGEVAVTIGAQQQGMVAGDPVNTASRVQSVATPGEVWVDQTTKNLTSGAISYADVGSHELKGKSEPMALWSARAVIGAVGGDQRADGLEAPFIGRDRDLRMVKELFHSTLDTSRPALVVVSGEPGVGKTRLGWELFKYSAGLSASVWWHQGRCLAYGEGVAYWALAEAVRLRLRLNQAEADDGDVTERLGDALDTYVHDPEEREWIGPRLATLLSSGSVGTFAREDLFAAWVTFFERVSGGEHVVLMIDDAQYADEGLLSFIEHLLASGTFPCLVLLLTRPGLLDTRPSLATNRRSTVLHLPVLETRDMVALVNGLVAGLPDDVSATLVERAEGIPLYAVETVRSLIDRDLVLPRGGQYVLADDAALDLDSMGAPASLQALVAARLDSLPPAQRRVIAQASILGPTFSIEAVAHLCPEIDLDDALQALVRVEILAKDANRLSAEFGQYRFVQIVVRQVAYSTLSRRDRKAGHVAAAHLLEASAEPGGDMDSVIARHYLDAIEASPTDDDVADLQSAAVRLLSSAAGRARALGAPGEAVGHLRLAVERVADASLRSHLEMQMARALLDAGGYEEAKALGERLTAAFDEAGDELAAARAAAIWGRALTVGVDADSAKALSVVRPRFDALRHREDAIEQVLHLLRVALTCVTLDGVTDLGDLHDEWLRLADRLGDHEQVADAYTSLALRYSSLGVFSLSRVLFNAAADVARTHHLPASLARTLSNLTSDTIAWDLRVALDRGREGVTAARRAGVAIWHAYAPVNLALAALNEGSWDEAERVLDDAPEVWESENQPIALAVTRLIAAARGITEPDELELLGAGERSLVDEVWVRLAHSLGTRAREGSLSELVEAIDRLVAHSSLSDDVITIWPAVVELAGELHDEVALRHLAALIDEAGTVVPLGLSAHRERLAARLAMTADDPEAVEGHLRRAIDRFTQWGSRSFRARAAQDLGEWLDRQGRSEEAAELLEQARATYVEIGAAGWLARLDSESASR